MHSEGSWTYNYYVLPTCRAGFLSSPGHVSFKSIIEFPREYCLLSDTGTYILTNNVMPVAITQEVAALRGCVGRLKQTGTIVTAKVQLAK